MQGKKKNRADMKEKDRKQANKEIDRCKKQIND